MIVAWVFLISGCDSRSTQNSVTVFAASSLTDVLPALQKEFEKEHPGIDVQLVFGGSQILRLQIEQGAAADLFISAHPEHVQSLIDQGLFTNPQPIAENPLVVIIAPDRASEIKRFEQLGTVRRLVLGDVNVPLGTYTEEVFEKADPVMGIGFAEQLRNAVVSRESNSRLVRSKVLLGEADAAFVYESDARNTEAGVIRLPGTLAAKARYVLASKDPETSLAAKQFRQFLVSSSASRVFKEFELPTLIGDGDPRDE